MRKGVVLLNGCATYKLTPKLDSSLSPKGENLARKTQVILPDSEHGLDFAPYIRKKFSESSMQKLSILSVKRKYSRGGEGFQCFEPLLYVITIGIIPKICTQEYTFEVEWQPEQGPLQRKEIVVEEKGVAGWAAIIVTLFPGWSWSSFGSVAFKSTLYSEVNSRAD